MASTGDFSVPVVEVNNQNFTEIWPSLLSAIKTSSYVAIDTELSGLGNRKQLLAKSVDERYKGMSESAKTRAIISLGLSCFKLTSASLPPETEYKPTQDSRCSKFLVQTFNIILLCSENYVVEPLSLKFLVDHGFDFNKQCATGLPYERGCDQKSSATGPSVRGLLIELIRSHTPVIFHNALMDLIFIYENLYATLPASLSTFMADLTEMFPAGLFDTKYITEFEARFTASYLEYVYRKSQRENRTRQMMGHTSTDVSFADYLDSMPNLTSIPCPLLNTTDQTKQKSVDDVCKQFSGFGWCNKGTQCDKSHDIDDILDTENSSPAKKKRRRNKKKKEETNDVPPENGEDMTEAAGDKVVESKTADEHIVFTTLEFMIDKLISEARREVENGDLVSGIAEGEMCSAARPSTSDIEIRERQINLNTNTENIDCTPPKENNRTESKQTVSIKGGHSAGFDAFMTGFTFAFFSAKLGKKGCDSIHGLDHCVNRLALGGKDIPLQVVKSTFAKTSRLHREKMELLQNM